MCQCLLAAIAVCHLLLYCGLAQDVVDTVPSLSRVGRPSQLVMGASHPFCCFVTCLTDECVPSLPATVTSNPRSAKREET